MSATNGVLAEHDAPTGSIRPRSLAANLLPPLGLFALVVAVWQAVVVFVKVNQLLIPAPSAIASALYRGLSSGLYWEPISVTMVEALIGFVVGSLSGMALGVIVSQSRMLQRMLMPYVIAFQALPK